jgi:biopolymer transport protein ExbD
VRFARRRDAEPEINVTSLIDVVLLLVLFFMVSTSFVSEGGLKLVLPSSHGSDVAAASARVTIVVAADGTYLVNGRALVNHRAQTLRAALEPLAGSDAARASVVIRADARATHQSVVTAMDVAGRLGFARVDIATVNQDPDG